VAAIGEPRGARSVTGPARRSAGARVLYALVSLASAALCLTPVLTIVLSAHDPITTRVTWTGDISRIVHARCVSCHAPDGRGPMSLATYEDARPWARTIKEEVMTRRMPKWHAVRGYGDFSNDPSLSPFEIALIAAWANGGAPKGTEADATTVLAVTPNAKPNRDIEPPIGARDITLPCGEQPAPVGALTAVHLALEPKQSAGITVRLPDGRREIVAWIKNFEPEFATTYRLRVPLVLPPGSVITTEARGRCAITLTVAAPR
jgi:hypothetical protein